MSSRVRQHKSRGDCWCGETHGPDLKKPPPPAVVSIAVDVEALMARAVAFLRRYRREHDGAYSRQSNSIASLRDTGDGDPTHGLVALPDRQDIRACLYESGLALDRALRELTAAHSHLDDIHHRGNAIIGQPYPYHYKISDDERKQSRAMQEKRQRNGNE
jgi:hypothetical protein